MTATKSPKKPPSKPQQTAVADYRVKRVYEAPAADDGTRVLVDRLWPRGLTKEKARIDVWLKDLAPSHALRRLVHDDPDRWAEFEAGYARELEDEPAKTAVAQLRALATTRRATLLYAARNEVRNNATVLKHWLETSK